MTNNATVTPKAGKTFIATYGSLRRNMQNFRVNGSGGGEFFGLGSTDNNYNLYRYNGAYFPSVSLEHSSNNKPVVVDVFEAPLTGLTGPYDSLEGYPNFYNRTQVPITLDDGRKLLAWIYHIDEDQGSDDLVESGDWCSHNISDYYENLNS